jgi:hypothetical protein
MKMKLVDMTKEQLEALSKKMDMENPVLNRIKSVAVEKTLVGESFRGVQNADRSNVER